MMIPCSSLCNILESYLIEQIEGKHLKLVTFLLGSAPEQLSFVAIKERLAKKIGVSFELKQYPTPPPITIFKKELRDIANSTETTGVIIQHPLPDGYDYAQLYEVLSYKKDIEGHKSDSTFHFPLSLSVLAGLKYVINSHQGSYTPGTESILNFEKDKTMFQKYLHNKQIVIAGRGLTGGKPISEAFDDMGVKYMQVHSQTPAVEQIYKNADIIITATGKKILTPDILKKGVVLLNVGLRKEEGKLKGDYDEDEVKDIASFYTPTPGGLGPLDVLYLYKNLLDAYNLQ